MSPLASVLLAFSAVTTVYAQTGCLSFQNSQICPQNNGYVFRATTSYANTTAFDNYNRIRMENNTAYVKNWQTLYGCPKWDGSGLRYRFSVICALAVDQASFPEKWPSPINQTTACKGTTSVMTPICKETCDAAKKSFEDVFNNPLYCDPESAITAAQSKSRAQTLLTHATLCGSLQAGLSTCFSGNTPLEEKTCGFFKTADFKTYCSTEAGKSDTCCTGQGPNVGVIAGVIIAVLFMIAGVVFTVLFIRKRRHNLQNPLRYTETKPSIFSFFSKPAQKEDTVAVDDRTAKGFTIYGDAKKEEMSKMSMREDNLYIDGKANPFSDQNGQIPPQSDPFRDPPYPMPALTNNTRPPVESVYDPTADYTMSMYGGVPDNRATFLQDDMFPTGVKKGGAPVIKGILKPQQSQAEVIVDKKKNRQSAIPELDGEKVKVVAKYVPNMDDELVLNVGDIILVEESFDDGWAVGKNLSTGTEGCFPMACCAPEKAEVKSSLPKDIRKRVSSFAPPAH